MICVTSGKYGLVKFFFFNKGEKGLCKMNKSGLIQKR